MPEVAETEQLPVTEARAGEASLDLCNGEPLHYKKLNDLEFLLYSVGWNEKDDGGVTAENQNAKSVDLEQGDWVWPTYAEK